MTVKKTNLQSRLMLVWVYPGILDADNLFTLYKPTKIRGLLFSGVNCGSACPNLFS